MRSLHAHSPIRSLPALTLALLALLGAVALAGCAGDSSAGTSSTSAASATPAAATGTTESAAPVPEVAQVDLMMDWIPWVLDIPIDVAQAKGLYKEAGLTVKQTVPSDPTDVVKFVSTGRSQFGLYYAPDTLMGVAEGAPLLSVGSLMPHAPVGMAAKPGFKLASPKDLEGHTAAVPLIPSTRASYDSLLAAGGVDPAQVKLVDPGFDLVAPLLKGTFDSVAFTEFGELVEAEQTGQKLDFLDFRDWGTPDFAFLNVVTTNTFAQKNPATVRAFVKATFAGLQYAAAHPEEAVDLYVTAHPELKKELLLAQWRAALPSMAQEAGGHPAGWQDPAAWRALNAWMVETKLLKEPVAIDTAVSNDFLPAAK